VDIPLALFPTDPRHNLALLALDVGVWILESTRANQGALLKYLLYTQFRLLVVGRNFFADENVITLLWNPKNGFSNNYGSVFCCSVRDGLGVSLTTRISIMQNTFYVNCQFWSDHLTKSFLSLHVLEPRTDAIHELISEIDSVVLKIKILCIFRSFV